MASGNIRVCENYCNLLYIIARFILPFPFIVHRVLEGRGWGVVGQHTNGQNFMSVGQSLTCLFFI